MLFDTIAAISTAAVDGAISIIRLSGSEAIDIVNQMVRGDLHQQKSHTISYRFLIDPVTKEEIDEVLISVFKAPKTYTCEDVVELNCHGGRFLTKRILEIVLSLGARLARPGEFTQRAYLNGRIDLTQAEAVNDIISSQSMESAKLAVKGVKGSVKTLLNPLIDSLLDIIANIEVNIDYPEYDDVEQLTNETILPKIEKWLVDIDDILKRANSTMLVKEGIKTVIIGKPNVGKSSLLNALLEEEKAIVSDVAGTTRDIVEGRIQLDGFALHLIDTAGLHESDDIVEKIGMERSLKALEDAQLVIFMLDASTTRDEDEQVLLEQTQNHTRIVVYNKVDLCEVEDGIAISAKDGKIQPLLDEIHRLFDNKLVQMQPSLANERQISLMKKAYLAMLHAKEALEFGMELDIVAIDIQNAYTSLKEILGEVHREDLLDALFSNFCLGK
jgi:tRNA modification GTPase